MKPALLCLVALALSLLSSGALADDSGFEFVTVASGAQEIQPPGGVDTDTKAFLRVRVSVDQSSASFRVRVANGKKITQAHLHCARAGVNGPVVAFIFNFAPVPGPGGVNLNGDLLKGKLTNADIIPNDFAGNPSCGVAINNIASLLAALKDGLIYLNIHSEGNPPGEVRGQLVKG